MLPHCHTVRTYWDTNVISNTGAFFCYDESKMCAVDVKVRETSGGHDETPYDEANRRVTHNFFIVYWKESYVRFVFVILTFLQDSPLHLVENTTNYSLWIRQELMSSQLSKWPLISLSSYQPLICQSRITTVVTNNVNEGNILSSVPESRASEREVHNTRAKWNAADNNVRDSTCAFPWWNWCVVTAADETHLWFTLKAWQQTIS